MEVGLSPTASIWQSTVWSTGRNAACSSVSGKEMLAGPVIRTFTKCVVEDSLSLSVWLLVVVRTFFGDTVYKSPSFESYKTDLGADSSFLALTVGKLLNLLNSSFLVCKMEMSFAQGDLKGKMRSCIYVYM